MKYSTICVRCTRYRVANGSESIRKIDVNVLGGGKKRNATLVKVKKAVLKKEISKEGYDGIWRKRKVGVVNRKT